MTVIAMTREIGSHGSEVAAQVAAELGLEIINSEIVAPQVAGAMGIAASAVQRYLDGKATLFDRWQIDTRKLSQYTLDQILNLALKDDVLIRGWGAAALFQGYSRRHMRADMRADGIARGRDDGTARCQGCRCGARGDREFRRHPCTGDARGLQLRLERCPALPHRPELGARADRRVRQGGVPNWRGA